MKVPESFLAEFEAAKARDIAQSGDEDIYGERLWSFAESRHSPDVAYPPFGFVAFPGLLHLDHGQGDYDGFYWPIGREDQEPLVARTAHYQFGMIPIASSWEKYQELRAWGEARYEEEKEREEFGEEARSINTEEALAERLAVDPGSPYLLTAMADVASAAGDVDRAEALYRQALDRIPEYTAARIGLALLLRRNRRGVEALGQMLKALRSPIPLWGTFGFSNEALPTDRVNRDDYRRKFLDWIQRTKPTAAGEHADDPLYQARDRLTFATGVKENDDYKVYGELIDAYIARGEPIEAVGLAMVYNELMVGETVSFREREADTETTQRARLMKTLQAAGLTPRAEWLASLPEPSSTSGPRIA